ncbi:MAG: 4-hydroxy-3-methylbut-2-enyl diphosphate reductase [Opitutales bacterium]
MAHQLLIAQPRGFCAGVVRAVDIVERALERYGAPVYVLHEIVHNPRVLDDLRARGAIFTENMAEIPRGSVLVFSAHGVPRSRYDEAAQRGLRVIDAICPLVLKVHREVTRHAAEGREVVLIGHAGHVEVEGILGSFDASAGGRIHRVDSVEDVARLRVDQPENLAYVTQTTLSLRETETVVQALQRRFPRIRGPLREDICYATQNRQNAVDAIAPRIDILVVVGAHNSSNSNRLREVGASHGLPAYQVEHPDELQPQWFRAPVRIGLTAGASTPDCLIDEVVNRLREWGVRQIVEAPAFDENVHFPVPKSLSPELRAEVPAARPR